LNRLLKGGFWAICPEIQGANGQGETIEEAKANLIEAIKLILDDKLEDFKRGISEEVIIDTVAVE
jgi:predicted RNase H-like HicB family nuclease